MQAGCLLHLLAWPGHCRPSGERLQPFMFENRTKANRCSAVGSTVATSTYLRSLISTWSKQTWSCAGHSSFVGSTAMRRWKQPAAWQVCGCQKNGVATRTLRSLRYWLLPATSGTHADANGPAGARHPPWYYVAAAVCAEKLNAQATACEESTSCKKAISRRRASSASGLVCT